MSRLSFREEVIIINNEYFQFFDLATLEEGQLFSIGKSLKEGNLPIVCELNSFKHVRVKAAYTDTEGQPHISFIPATEANRLIDFCNRNQTCAVVAGEILADGKRSFVFHNLGIQKTDGTLKFKIITSETLTLDQVRPDEPRNYKDPYS